ncbi:thiamine pyrophosphate-binding protein [Sphingomonas canadensis]|uniref:thiamine pyrophosphate-binding protein n=1 Tax=Sphingomonas canadensis TaxID=1219257 RepID=UPI00222FB5E5|nr:thiamine pyrophosphate-binding protein [Sphingomonas canadensis]MCW3834722.1 thiamine pyrophosphate-binding protein [Sphingomonas canadensis]
MDTIFGLHGAHIETVFQSCADHGLELIDTRHEAAAGHAAEGYARASGKLGVALVTAGGGFTNAVTPIANAFLDRTPVLFITGSGAMADDETNTLQAGIDQVALAKPITKWAHQVTVTANIPRLVAQALRIAMSGPRGPVLLDFPWNILTQEIDQDAIALPDALDAGLPAAPSPQAVARAITILEAAERPIIVVGSEAVRSGAASALRAFVDRTGIPVFSDYEGHGLLPDEHPAAAGLIQGAHGLMLDGKRADAALMLGVRFGLYTAGGSGRLIPEDAAVIQVDQDARELGRLRDPALAVSADSAQMLAALVEALAAGAPSDARIAWRDAARDHARARRIALDGLAHDRSPIHPFRAASSIVEASGERADYVADGAECYHWFTEVVPGRRPATFLTHSFLGSMGIGIGLAMGAQAADRTRPVILVTGDGAFGYSVAEFDTMFRHRLPVVVIIMNNRNWGATRHFQEVFSGPNRVTGTQLENGDYHDAAAAFGAFGCYIDQPADVAAAVRSAIASGGPACINIRVDFDAVPPEAKIMLGRDPLSAD